MGEELNIKVLELMWTSIKSECGDGDAIWLSKHTPLYELVVLINKFNVVNNTGWELKIYENHLVWGIDQEWAIITDDSYFFQEQPDWIILKIDY